MLVPTGGSTGSPATGRRRVTGLPFIMGVMSQSAASSTPSMRGETWNSSDRIVIHRGLTPSERLRLTIEASRAALRFAEGERVDERRADVRA